MELLPAIRTSMGDLHCCTVHMSTYRIACAMQVPPNLYIGPGREKDAARQEKIMHDMATQEYRPFPPIVAAINGGAPVWSPMEFDADTLFGKLFRGMEATHGLGVLALDGSHHYGVLDGRRRVAAIRSLIDGTMGTAAPLSFEKKMLPVSLVFPKDPDEQAAAWPGCYQKLFVQLHPPARNKTAGHVSAA